jgi:myo-inositol-1(or 4)-monophosphatase
MRPELIDLEALARAAGEILRAGYGQAHQVRYKGMIDLVTEYDHLAEARLLEEIRQRWPGQRLVSEESGTHAGQGRGEWLIDPLDGTVNFAHGLPIFAVSLAYAEGGQVILGAVYAPVLDECYSAARGRGAWLNGQPIHCTQPADLDHSLLTTGFSYDIRSLARNNLAEHNRLALRSQGVRRFGSAALDLCFLAAGRFDGYWELEIKPWDVAAGGLIAEESGARVTNMEGGADYLTPPCSILAASPAIHAQLLKELGEV